MTTSDRSKRLDIAIQRAINKSGYVRTQVAYVGEWPDLLELVPRVSELHGRINLVSDRCAYGAQMILAGADTYQHVDDGRWTISSGQSGSHGVLHPRGLFDGLRMARGQIAATADGQFEIELDNHRLHPLIDVFPTWQARSHVTVDESGNITSAALRLIDAPTSATEMRTNFTFEWTQDPLIIELPPRSQIVSLTRYLEERQT